MNAFKLLFSSIFPIVFFFVSIIVGGDLEGQCNAFSDGFESGDVSAWTSVFPLHDPIGKNQQKADGGFSVSTSLMADPSFTEITPLTGNFFGEIFSNGGVFSAGLTIDVALPDTSTGAMLMWNDWWAHNLSGASGTDFSVSLRVRQGAAIVENMLVIDGSGAASNPGTGWIAKTLDLTPYIGTTVSITFQFSSSAASGYICQYGLDDVKVALTPCPATDPVEIVPTLGEWSVITLVLLFSIVLVVGFRQFEAEKSAVC